MNNVKDKLYEQVYEQVRWHADEQVNDQVWWEVDIQVSGQVYIQIKNSLKDTVNNIDTEPDGTSLSATMNNNGER